MKPKFRPDVPKSRRRYQFLTPAAGRHLRRLKRLEGFRDMAADPRPGSPALVREWRDPVGRLSWLETVVVYADGAVSRIALPIIPLKALPSQVLPARAPAAARRARKASPRTGS